MSMGIAMYCMVCFLAYRSSAHRCISNSHTQSRTCCVSGTPVAIHLSLKKWVYTEDFHTCVWQRATGSKKQNHNNVPTGSVAEWIYFTDSAHSLSRQGQFWPLLYGTKVSSSRHLKTHLVGYRRIMEETAFYISLGRLHVIFPLQNSKGWKTLCQTACRHPTPYCI